MSMAMGTQSDFRESEAQTTPYEPDTILPAASLDVSIRGERVAQLNELDVFGEGALFDEARSATVTVASPTLRLLELERTTFDELVASGTLGAACVEELRVVGRKRREENAARSRARRGRRPR